ncbi:hypothetical protein DPMN_049258 [Dreissena polymorpha]|uniref:Uncharacterized protein n=1 Tax=Dreissena polymorpha TaxID=45954 RepID=A0A9D4CFK3_DREPO|nr:hypothetical protein DPMN_049258 [Dreissena polymorpha]
MLESDGGDSSSDLDPCVANNGYGNNLPKETPRLLVDTANICKSLGPKKYYPFYEE